MLVDLLAPLASSRTNLIKITIAANEAAADVVEKGAAICVPDVGVERSGAKLMVVILNEFSGGLLSAAATSGSMVKSGCGGVFC